MPTRTIRRCLGIAAAILVVASAGVAQADTVPTVNFSIGSTPLNGASHDNGDGSFTLTGQQQGGGTVSAPVWDMAWNVTVNVDPSIIGSLTLTNLSSTVRTFKISLSLLVSPGFSPSVFGGSVTTSLLDFNGNGSPANGSAALTPSSESPAIYRGTIDGIPVLQLLGLSLQCGPGSPSCSANTGDMDGLPGPTLPGPGVASSIGTLIYFTLTPGDRVTFNTNFTVEPVATVPLPAALPLLMLGLGGLGAGRFARRKKGTFYAVRSRTCMRTPAFFRR